jgi:hypothetical protein
MTVSSDSDGETESDPSFTPSSSVESTHGFEVAEQADDMVTEREEPALKGRTSSLNAQLFVSYVEARNLDLKQGTNAPSAPLVASIPPLTHRPTSGGCHPMADCVGIYSVLSLGKQQVRTVDTKSAGLSRSAQWSEGFYLYVSSWLVCAAAASFVSPLAPEEAYFNSPHHRRRPWVACDAVM